MRLVCFIPYDLVHHHWTLTSVKSVPRSGQLRLTCVAIIKAFNYASSSTDVIASYGGARENVVQQREASFLGRFKDFPYTDIVASLDAILTIQGTVEHYVYP